MSPGGNTPKWTADLRVLSLLPPGTMPRMMALSRGMRRPSDRTCSGRICCIVQQDERIRNSNVPMMLERTMVPLCSRRIPSTFSLVHPAVIRPCIVLLSMSWSNLVARICSLGFRALRSSDLVHSAMAWNLSPLLYRFCGNTPHHCKESSCPFSHQFGDVGSSPVLLTSDTDRRGCQWTQVPCNLCTASRGNLCLGFARSQLPSVSPLAACRSCTKIHALPRRLPHHRVEEEQMGLLHRTNGVCCCSPSCFRWDSCVGRSSYSSEVLESGLSSQISNIRENSLILFVEQIAGGLCPALPGPERRCWFWRGYV